MPGERAPTPQHHFGRSDQQRQRHIQIAVRQPSEHRHGTPIPRELGDRCPPVVAPVLDPLGLVLHVDAVHVVVHRGVRAGGHIEIAVALGQQRVERDHRVGGHDLGPRGVELRHVLLGHRAPLIADLLGLDAGGLDRVGVILTVCVRHLVQVEDRFQQLRGGFRDAFGVELGHARDLLELDAAALDRIAVDDQAGLDHQHHAAVDQHGRQQQRGHIDMPAAAVGDQRQQDL